MTIKVLALNFIKKDLSLTDGLSRVFNENNVELELRRAVHCSMALINGKITVYDKDQELSLNADLAIVRGRGLHAHMSSLLVRMLKSRQIKIAGSLSAGEYTNNDGKITQMVDLSLAHLPIPNTFIFSRHTLRYLPILVNKHQQSFPMVLKSTGSKGQFVWKVESWGDIEDRVQNCESGKLFLLQEYIPNTFDIRALYFQREFIGAIARRSVDGFYNNASLGADVAEIELTEEENNICLKATEAVGQDFVGVDIVRSDRGPLLFEVNNRPGFEGFEKATGLVVGERLAEIILSKS